MSSIEKRLNEIKSSHERILKSFQPTLRMVEKINKSTAAISNVNKIIDNIHIYAQTPKVGISNEYQGYINDATRIPDYVKTSFTENSLNYSKNFIDATNIAKDWMDNYKRISGRKLKSPNSLRKFSDGPVRITIPAFGIGLDNRKFYGGEDISSLVYKKELKTFQLENRIREIDEFLSIGYDSYREILETGFLGKFDKRSKIDDEELLKEFIYRGIAYKFNEVKKLSGFVKSLDKQIRFILARIKKKLRNLRQVYKKLHSFHFKNLDDYHSIGLNFSMS